MKQGDLIIWYVEQQNALGAYSNTDEVREEVKCIKAIIEVRVPNETYRGMLGFHLDWPQSLDCVERCYTEVDTEGRPSDSDR